jgi:hypothetical protein
LQVNESAAGRVVEGQEQCGGEHWREHCGNDAVATAAFSVDAPSSCETGGFVALGELHVRVDGSRSDRG